MTAHERQHAVLAALVSLARERGKAPSDSEIASRVGWPRAEVADLLFVLKDRGLVTTIAGRPVATMDGVAHVAPAAEVAC